MGKLHFDFSLMNYLRIISDNSVGTRRIVNESTSDCLIFSSYFMKMLFLSATREGKKRRKKNIEIFTAINFQHSKKGRWREELEEYLFHHKPRVKNGTFFSFFAVVFHLLPPPLCTQRFIRYDISIKNFFMCTRKYDLKPGEREKEQESEREKLEACITRIFDVV